ncbi:hypothetical protein GCM10007971_20850 [Oceanobacillus indicireducens]|uniref:Uncharacterized protein n=1 Tax=Oceanobacillus indicireducens TaxID=1004261 RepID=A0A918D2B8_9BACI|nr:hypothetical protein GCM10007971_20850 [Oceanobacillus indicireducens]
MRVFLSILITLLLLITLSLGLAYFTNSGFLDYAFFIVGNDIGQIINGSF